MTCPCDNRPPSAVITVAPETIRDDRPSQRRPDLPAQRRERHQRPASRNSDRRYHGVKYLPVVDAGRLVGIVAFRRRPRQRRRDPGAGAGPRRCRWRRGHLAGATVTSSSEPDR